MAATAVHPCSPIVASWSPSPALHRALTPLSKSSVCSPFVASRSPSPALHRALTPLSKFSFCSPNVSSRSPSLALRHALTPLSNSSVCAPRLQKTPITNETPRRTGRSRKFNVPTSVGTASKTQQTTEPDQGSQSEKRHNKRKKTVDNKEGDADDDAKGKKRAKKIADPNMPKRPAAAFFFFMSSLKDEFKKENPDSKGAALFAKAGGAKWKSMSSDEKLPFVKKAEEEKAAYEATMKLYKSQHSSLSTDGSGSSSAAYSNDTTSTEEDVADNMAC